MLQLQQMLPFPDTLTVVELTGKQLREAIENAVSMYPAHDGRWPSVSGLKFKFNPSQTPRVSELQTTTGEPIVAEQDYTLAVLAYIAKGHDGFKCLQKTKVSFDVKPYLIDVIKQYMKKTENS
jgi:5'-nucleotidase